MEKEPIAAGSHEEHYLSDLRAISDAALRNLDIEEFLRELLDRVRQILKADTAAVLRMDSASESLIATAAQGIEQEVRQGVRVPVGKGFAGSVAAQQAPVVLDRVDSTTVANPILWEKGIQVMLGVPLMAGNRLLGVLHVGRLVRTPFTEQDVQLLQVVGERVAGALQDLTLTAERSAANLLEQSLLPGTMPSCPGLEFATRYMTPEDRSVGGDWYDGFVTPSGRLWVVVGDVAGRGLPAAVIMGRIKSTLRAYALLERPPDEVLSLTSRKFAHFEAEAMATVICVVSDPPHDEFHIASAGHPPPVLVQPSGETEWPALHAGAPIGLLPLGESGTTVVRMEPGSGLVLYTDGLIERRGEHLAVGMERLKHLIVPEPAEAMCQRIVRGVFGTSSPPDDVAVVAIRRTG